MSANQEFIPYNKRNNSRSNSGASSSNGSNGSRSTYSNNTRSAYSNSRASSSNGSQSGYSNNRSGSSTKPSTSDNYVEKRQAPEDMNPSKKFTEELLVGFCVRQNPRSMFTYGGYTPSYFMSRKQISEGEAIEMCAEAIFKRIHRFNQSNMFNALNSLVRNVNTNPPVVINVLKRIRDADLWPKQKVCSDQVGYSLPMTLIWTDTMPIEVFRETMNILIGTGVNILRKNSLIAGKNEFEHIIEFLKKKSIVLNIRNTYKGYADFIQNYKTVQNDEANKNKKINLPILFANFIANNTNISSNKAKLITDIQNHLASEE
jgi:hypothetical protein